MTTVTRYNEEPDPPDFVAPSRVAVQKCSKVKDSQLEAQDNLLPFRCSDVAWPARILRGQGLSFSFQDPNLFFCANTPFTVNKLSDGFRSVTRAFCEMQRNGHLPDGIT